MLELTRFGGRVRAGLARFGFLGALGSIHDRDRSEAGSRWPRCSAVVSS
jgi:hypothetical protein